MKNTTRATLADDTYITLGFGTKGTSTDTVDFYTTEKVDLHKQHPTANLKLTAMSLSGDAKGTKVTTIAMSCFKTEL